MRNFGPIPSCAKKWGIRTKMSFGSWFMGDRIDSSKRSLGRTLVSKELLAAAIYKRSCELAVAMKVLGGRTSAAVTLLRGWSLSISLSSLLV